MRIIIKVLTKARALLGRIIARLHKPSAVSSMEVLVGTDQPVGVMYRIPPDTEFKL